jgi:hypothetical protein
MNIKKILLATAVVIMAAGASVSVNAQKNAKAHAQKIANTQNAQKKFWLGGTLGFSSSENSTLAEAKSFTFSPEFGYNFNDRWAAGVQLGLSLSSIDGYDNTYNDIQKYSVAPFARYTFLNWKALSLFADGGIRWESTDGQINTITGEYSGEKVWYAGLFVNPGISVRLSKHFSLTGRVNIFDAGYMGASAYGHNNQLANWSASLNSPFDLDNFTFGFNVTF